jgi:hypothetical protein
MGPFSAAVLWGVLAYAGESTAPSLQPLAHVDTGAYAVTFEIERPAGDDEPVQNGQRLLRITSGNEVFWQRRVDSAVVDARLVGEHVPAVINFQDFGQPVSVVLRVAPDGVRDIHEFRSLCTLAEFHDASRIYVGVSGPFDCDRWGDPCLDMSVVPERGFVLRLEDTLEIDEEAGLAMTRKLVERAWAGFQAPPDVATEVSEPGDDAENVDDEGECRTRFVEWLSAEPALQPAAFSQSSAE